MLTEETFGSSFFVDSVPSPGNGLSSYLAEVMRNGKCAGYYSHEWRTYAPGPHAELIDMLGIQKGRAAEAVRGTEKGMDFENALYGYVAGRASD